MSNLYELDTAYFETDEQQKFSDFIDERDRHSRWEEVSVRNLQVRERFEAVRHTDISEKAEREAVIELFSTEMDRVLLRSIAIPSLLERARVSGSALSDLTVEVFADIVTRCLQTAKSSELTKVRIQDGKVSALMADTYKVINQVDIFAEASRQINAQFRGSFVKGAWNHCVTLADYTASLPTSDYKEIFKTKGMNFSDIVMNITVMTSESGYSGVNIYPSVVGIMSEGKHFKVPIMGEITMPHKGKACIEEFVSNMSLAFAQTEKSKDRLRELDKIDLNYPFNCFCNILKKVGIGKKVAKSVLDQFAVTVGNSAPATAADVYFKACEIGFEVDQKDCISLMTMEESISKILKLNDKAWSDFDRPVNCWSYSI